MRTLRAVKLFLLLLVIAMVASGCRGCLKGKLGQFFGQKSADSVNGIDSSALPEPIRGQTPSEIPEMGRIFFEYDSATLLEPAKEQMSQNAVWMKTNASVQIQIEGHCDERGTADYNMALGQRRADAARTYLISQGVDPGRLHTISYGAERPDDPAHNETAWARNRRVQFLVYAGQ